MKHLTQAAALVLAAVLVTIPAAPGVADDEQPNFAERALESVALGEPLQKGPVIVVPLVAFTDPADPGVVPAVSTEAVKFFEPDFPARRHDVGVRNDSDQPVLLLGGTVLVGGNRDRMTRHSRLIAPEAVAELRAMTAAMSSERRKEAVPFVMSETLAPIYLRREGDFGANLSAVDTFVNRWLKFRNMGDERKSLEAIAESKSLKTFCEACQASMSDLPAPIDGYRVIGMVTAVRGRIQSLCLFGTNELLRAHFATMLRAATYAAAAIDIRARKTKVPGADAGGGDPDEVLQEAQKLLDDLRKAKFKQEPLPEGTVGESFMIRTSNRTRGRAVGLDGRLAYLTIYPYDPFEAALYSREMRVPVDDLDIEIIVEDGSHPGIAELARRSKFGRLTPYEQRLLDRLGGSRGRMGPSPSSFGNRGGGAGGGGGGGPVGGGPVGGGGRRR